jgi:hypothetical protein
VHAIGLRRQPIHSTSIASLVADAGGDLDQTAAAVHRFTGLKLIICNCTMEKIPHWKPVIETPSDSVTIILLDKTTDGMYQSLYKFHSKASDIHSSRILSGAPCYTQCSRIGSLLEGSAFLAGEGH